MEDCSSGDSISTSNLELVEAIEAAGQRSAEFNYDPRGSEKLYQKVSLELLQAVDGIGIGRGAVVQ